MKSPIAAADLAGAVLRACSGCRAVRADVFFAAVSGCESTVELHLCAPCRRRAALDPITVVEVLQ